MYFFLRNPKTYSDNAMKSCPQPNQSKMNFFICVFDSIYRTNISLYICIISKYCNFNTSHWKLIVFIEYIVSRMLHDITTTLYWTPIMFISQVFECSKFYKMFQCISYRLMSGSNLKGEMYIVKNCSQIVFVMFQ